MVYCFCSNIAEYTKYSSPFTNYLMEKSTAKAVVKGQIRRISVKNDASLIRHFLNLFVANTINQCDLRDGPLIFIRVAPGRIEGDIRVKRGSA